MKTNLALQEFSTRDYSLTRHARYRMSGRGISDSAINLVLAYGRQFHVRGAIIYVVGRKEINFFESQGIDLSNLDGIQVVCASDGTVMTVYRNRDFRGLRPQRRRMH